MTFKSLCAAAVLAGCLLSIGNPALARGGINSGGMMPGNMGASRGMTSSVTNFTSGALPRLPSSGALPQLPTSGALPSSPTLPIVGPSLGTTTSSTTLIQPPSALPRASTNAPYQAPCGNYPLPQC